MDTVAERLGGALRRAPYAWLITTLVVMFVMTTSLSGIAREVGDGSSFLAAGASALAVLDGLIAVFLVPRQLEAARDRLSAARALVVRCAFALPPFFLSWAAVALGAEQWALSVGVILSTALLVQAARSVRRVRA